MHIFFNSPADAVKAVPDGLPAIRSEVQKQSVSHRDILIDHLGEFRAALAARDAEQLQALLKEGREKKATAGGN